MTQPIQVQPAPPYSDAWENLIRDIIKWQDVTFPHATPQSAAKHLRREAKELLDNPTDGGEQADVFILTVAVASLSGNNLYTEVRRKFKINQEREWGEPDSDGVVEHVK